MHGSAVNPDFVQNMAKQLLPAGGIQPVQPAHRELAEFAQLAVPIARLHRVDLPIDLLDRGRHPRLLGRQIPRLAFDEAPIERSRQVLIEQQGFPALQFLERSLARRPLLEELVFRAIHRSVESLELLK